MTEIKETMKETTDKKTEHRAKLASSPLVEVTKELNAPVESVWKAWTDPKLMQEWWGPEGFTSPSVESDFRIEGKYLSAMKSPEGQVFWSTGTYVEIIPNELIVCTDQFSDENGHVISPEEAGMTGDWKGVDTLLFSVKFQKIDEDHTRIFLVHEGIPEEMHDECVKGWDSTLEKLKKVVEKH